MGASKTTKSTKILVLENFRLYGICMLIVKHIIIQFFDSWVFFAPIMQTQLFYVTEPEKIGLMYIKYTYSYYGAYLLFFECYPNSVSFIEFLRNFCI